MRSEGGDQDVEDAALREIGRQHDKRERELRAEWEAERERIDTERLYREVKGIPPVLPGHDTLLTEITTRLRDHANHRSFGALAHSAAGLLDSQSAQIGHLLQALLDRSRGTAKLKADLERYRWVIERILNEPNADMLDKDVWESASALAVKGEA